MASAFGHAAAALGIGASLLNVRQKYSLWFLGIFSAVMPDADVIAFKFGIAYGSIWGHRGFTHSIVFAILWAFIISLIFFRKTRKIFFIALIYLFICTISHGVLDAMTTGGKGVGFFIPFDEGRYFLPWRKIAVSPLSIERFFSEWGLRVIKSELFFIFLPAFILAALQIGALKARKMWIESKS